MKNKKKTITICNCGDNKYEGIANNNIIKLKKTAILTGVLILIIY